MITTVGTFVVFTPTVEKFLSLIAVVNREEVRGERKVAMAIGIRSGARFGFTVIAFAGLALGRVLRFSWIRVLNLFLVLGTEGRVLEGRERLTMTSLCKSESLHHGAEVQLIFCNLQVMYEDTIELVPEVGKASIDEELSTKEVIREPPSMRWAKAIHGELCVGVCSHMSGHEQRNTFVFTLVELVVVVSWLDVDSFEDLLCSVFRS